MIHFLEAGKEVILGIFDAGEMFAVPPVFDGAPYPSTAIALEKTELLLLHRKDFLRLLKESAEFSFAVIGWMCEMLRDKSATIQNLATSSPVHRAGNILGRAAEKNGSENGAIKISLLRRDIAEMAGLTVETWRNTIAGGTRKNKDQRLLKNQSISRRSIVPGSLSYLRSAGSESRLKKLEQKEHRQKGGIQNRLNCRF